MMRPPLLQEVLEAAGMMGMYILATTRNRESVPSHPGYRPLAIPPMGMEDSLQVLKNCSRALDAFPRKEASLVSYPKPIENCVDLDQRKKISAGGDQTPRPSFRSCEGREGLRVFALSSGDCWCHAACGGHTVVGQRVA